jgi:indole-3-glycerol phosphate synthase
MLSNSNIIIDFKRTSPKDGDLFNGRDPISEVSKLERAGVLGVSVVTAEKEFGGSLDLLRSICGATTLPVLRKDFIQTESDLRDTLECGAKAVLLICATVPNISELHAKALELGLHPVVEIHTAAEMEVAKRIGAKIIEINNKDITVLEKDNGTIETTLELIRLAPKDAFVISASGIKNREDAERAIEAGANAVLVGTAFWRGDFIVE